MEAGELLRQARIRHGVTQAQLAVRGRTSQAAISRIERGVVSPSVTTLSSLLDLLGERLELASSAVDPGLDRSLHLERLALSVEDRIRVQAEHARAVRSSRPPSVSTPFTFKPIAVLAALADCGVDFVLIGGVAQGAHGSAYPTYDVDVGVVGTRSNVSCLSRALSSLGVRGADVRRGGIFETNAGAVDITIFPPQRQEYRRLAADAMRASVERREIRVASIDHLIAMRERRNRPYDPLLSLELRILADEQRRQS